MRPMIAMVFNQESPSCLILYIDQMKVVSMIMFIEFNYFVIYTLLIPSIKFISDLTSLLSTKHIIFIRRVLCLTQIL